jgi:hypothetical protein
MPRNEPAETLASPPATTPPRWITWRSLLIGSAVVAFVCGLAPYNDYVVANTWLVGGYLPPALTLTFFVLIVFINAPLHRFMPRRALSSGELAVIMAMLLVACSLPGQGLMRQLIPMLVWPFHIGSQDPIFWRAFSKLRLHPWLFPVTDIDQGMTDPVVRDFYGRVQAGQAIPYRAWIVPLFAWTILSVGLWMSLISLSLLLFEQWATTERLPFPIAQVQAALIEPPRPGRALNDLLASPIFWIGLGAVFCIRSLIALHAYFPKYFPEITLSYNFAPLIRNEPWVNIEDVLKKSTLYFTWIGICYFIQARISFSLWAMLILREIAIVQARSMHSEITVKAWDDQHLGACFAFVLGVLWIGRRHWKTVLRTRRPTCITFIVGLVIMLGWLLIVGVTWWVAMTLVGFALLSHFIVARIVAETGFPFFRAYPNFSQIYNNLSPKAFTGRDIFFSNVSYDMVGANITRESVLPFSLHALFVYNSTRPPAQERRRLVGAIVWALVLGFLVSAFSSLHNYYTHVTPITPRVPELVNQWGTEDGPKSYVVEPFKRWDEGHFVPVKNSWWHMATGFAVTAVLHMLSLRWAGWPLAPIGYLMSTTWYVQVGFFSIFVGWLCKVLILRLGGARLFQQAKPLFVGIIFGEALASGVWLMITLILASMGYDYRQILMLPQ